MAGKLLATRRIGWCAMLTVLASAGGCSLALPSLHNPGHVHYQQLRATHFDPYANTYSAHEIEGGRPRAFDKPRALPETSQWTLDVR